MIETASLPSNIQMDGLSENQHLHKARLNTSFLREIRETKHYDWIVIVCFYIQLHYVLAFLKHAGHQVPASHRERYKKIKEIIHTRKKGCDQLKKITEYYGDVEMWSQSARYTYELDLSNHEVFRGGGKLQRILDATLKTVPTELGYPTEPIE